MDTKTAFSTVAIICIFVMLSACGTPAPHPNRVPVSGAMNFRDVGGYQTEDGQFVKKGVLFRSDELAKLTGRDLEVFADLGLRRVFDIRDEKRRTSHPSRIYDIDGLEVVDIPIHYAPMDRSESRRKILSADVEPGHFRELMIEANRAFVLEFRPQWTQLLRELATPDALPALIHCADGKDRTGFAVALILRAVGVSEETVMADFLLSNYFTEPKIRRRSNMAYVGSLFRVPKSEILPLLGVRREYLEAAFESIREHYGSLEAYLETGLGLDSETLLRLRVALLESQPSSTNASMVSE